MSVSSIPMMRTPPDLVPLGSFLPDGGRLKPARAGRAQALAAIAGIHNPTAIWRALGYAEDPARMFRRVAAESRGPEWIDSSRTTANLDGGPYGLIRCFVRDQAYPFAVEEAVAFASDAPRIAVVESEARAYARAILPWTHAEIAASRIAWRFLRFDASIPALAGGAKTGVIDECVEQALESAGVTVVYIPERRSSGSLWRDAAARGLSVPRSLSDPYFVHGALGAPLVPDAVAGKRFSDLENPFESLERMSALGYQLENVDADVITLVAAAAPPIR